MQKLLNTSAYESPALMVILFVVGTIGILLMLIVKPSELKAPQYGIKPKPTPYTFYKRSLEWFWGLLITGMILYAIF